MKNLLASTLAIILLFGAAAPARVKPDGYRAWEHVKVLASDELKGRKSGTPEYRKAAEYVAAQMKEYGLQPGGENGTWFQEVPLKNWRDFEPPIRLEIVAPQRRVYFAGRGRDFMPVVGTGSGIVRGQPVFGGYGIVSEKHDWNDYENMELKGRIVLFLPDSPTRIDPESQKEWTLEKKIKTAVTKGAAGAIVMDVATSEVQRRRVRFLTLEPGTCPEGFVVIQAGRNFLDDLFYLAKKSWKDPVSKILREEKPHPVTLEASIEMEVHFVAEERTASNVFGRLPGRDPRLQNEYIILGGHLDHLGTGMDGFIYNGADDNAASAAVILETARVLAANKTKLARTIVFACWAAEEIGYQGSGYYTQHPLYPLEKTAVYMNMDMVGMGDSDLLIGGMYEFSDFFDIVKAGLDEDTQKKLRSRLNYRSSDHISFWNKGVTSFSLRTGGLPTHKLDDEHPEYHHPGDMAELIDPELLRLAAQYHHDALIHLANSSANLLDPKHRILFIHKDAAVADLHCDTIDRYVSGADLSKDNATGHIDIPKLKRGGVDLQVFACYVAAPSDELQKFQAAKRAFDQIEGIYRLVDENPEDLAVVQSYEDFQKIFRNGKTGILIAIEGGYAIESDLSLLSAFHRAGVRLMTLTHWTHTDWADASGDPEPVFGGLTELGEKVVKEMNRLGMIIDVSHAHDETFWDVIKISSAPIVASHSCCRALSDHHRNLSDEMLKALAKNGGVIGINFMPGFLNVEHEKMRNALMAELVKKYGLPADYQEIMRADPKRRQEFFKEFRVRLEERKKTLPPVNVKTLVDHIDHVVKITGSTDHVGLGSDFDGISSTPIGLANIGYLPNITLELAARGYTEADIKKILGGNFLRVVKAVCGGDRGTHP
ncbi:MAG: M20/M25/M40 family metallo-hydrolase [Candidatus Aminicenantales bacterium]